MFPVLLVPLFFLPAAAVAMHAVEVDRLRSACRSCGRQVDCRCGIVSISTAVLVAPRQLAEPRESVPRARAAGALGAMDQEIELKVSELEDAGLPVPEVAASKLSEGEVQAYLDAARVRGVIDKAIPVLLTMGVPPEVIFLTKAAIRHRDWFGPTIFDFLPERWRRAIDDAVRSDWQTDDDLTVAFLTRVGFSRETAEKIIDVVSRGGEDARVDREAFGRASGRWDPSGWNRAVVRRQISDY